jgi:hypothetical protein
MSNLPSARPHGLTDNVDPKVRCAAYGCIQPAGSNFTHGEFTTAPEFCCVHEPIVGAFDRWMRARSLAGPEQSFRCARMHWDGTIADLPPNAR